MVRDVRGVANWVAKQGVLKGTLYLSIFTLISSQMITCSAYFFVLGSVTVQTVLITPVVTVLIAAPVALVIIQLITILIDSEDKYVMAVEAMHGLLWEWDPASQQLTTYPGRLDSHELEAFDTQGSGQRFSLLVHPEDRDRYLSTFKKYLRGDTSFYECKYRIRNHAGGYSWVHDRAIGRKGDDGRFNKIVGAVQLIAERTETANDPLDPGIKKRVLNRDLRNAG